MKYPDNCVIIKELFPDTAVGLDEMFVFVNIDCDLYMPIRNGLDYFWNHLAESGYIFIHDYQDPVYSGARKAIRRVLHGKQYCLFSYAGRLW